MTSRLISPTKAQGFTNLYLDFLAGHEPARNLFIAADYAQVAARIDRTEYPRHRIVDILYRQNTSFRASERTMTNIERLGDSNAVCLFAGQQAGFLGGPMFSVIKALAVCKAAALRTGELGRPVVPVFWIAADDHDFAEVASTYVLDRSGELCKIEYAAPPPEPWPVGYVRLDDESALRAAFVKLHECLGDTAFTQSLYDLLARCYDPQDTFATAFGKLIASLTAEYGLVLFSPTDAEAKRLAAPLFKRILERQDKLHEVLNSTNQRLTDANYHVQVRKEEPATYLFINEGGRRPIVRHGSDYAAGEKTYSKDELFALIDKQPELFSPDVLTRPLMQSCLFPTVGQLGGPSEIAYFAQINPLFGLFDLPVPVHRPRPGVTLVEAKQEKFMAKHNIRFEDLTGDIEQVVNDLLARSFPVAIEDAFEHLRADVFSRFDEFRDRALEFDRSLDNSAKLTAGKIDFTLKQFESKVFAAHKKRYHDLRAQIYQLWHALYPNRALQDRSLNLSYFVAKYGFGIVSFMYEHMDPDQPAHQVLSLTEYTG